LKSNETLRRSIFLTGAVAASTAAAWPRIARAQSQTVRIGVLKIMSDAPFYVAARKNFWKDENIDVQFSTFASSGDMVVPFSQGALDVGGGTPAAGLYNGVARGLMSRLVADRGTDAPGYGFDKLLVRADLVKSGKFKTVRDLKGMTIAGNEAGSGSSAALFVLLQKNGLSWRDVNRQKLGFPLHVAALENGKVDASYTAEPYATLAVQSGAAVKIMSDDQWYPNQQLSAVLYAGDFMAKRSDLAHKFMRGYVRAARFYFGGLKNGTFSGANGPEIVSILNDELPQTSKTIYREVTPSFIGPDVKFEMASMKRDLDYFRSQNLVESKTIGVNDIIELSYLDRALKEIGPYKGAGKGEKVPAC
jgi:NitT/TauT family transport system substrate-binding protein